MAKAGADDTQQPQPSQCRISAGLFTTVTGVSGSGKSSLVSQALVELVADELGSEIPAFEDEGEELERAPQVRSGGRIVAGMHRVKHLVRVDQKPIGRTPRSNLVTYAGLFDAVRKLFAATKAARVRHYDAGRFHSTLRKGAARRARARAS